MSAHVFLCQVSLSPEQTEKLKQTFFRLSDGEGYVNRYKFSEGLKNLGITNELLIEQVLFACQVDGFAECFLVCKNWNAFDDDHDGRVSIQEFLTAIAIMSSGELSLCFSLFWKLTSFALKGLKSKSCDLCFKCMTRTRTGFWTRKRCCKSSKCRQV